MNYFPETGETLTGCFSSRFFYLAKFSKNLDYYKFDKSFELIGNKIKKYFFIFPSNETKYKMFYESTDDNYIHIKYLDFEVEKIKNYTIDEYILNCTNYYNYDKTDCLNNIPIGYYCNSTTDKTIDKCHDNCYECDSGPNENNHNCKSCKSSFYFYHGNCLALEDCTNRVYTESGINYCKCLTNNACDICPLENNENNLCESCNIENGYYPIKDDVNKDLKSCYNSLPDPGNYFLVNEVYEPCYESCKKCNGIGDKSNHKCTECLDSTYYHLADDPNDNNCYLICDYYYFFFDENGDYQCSRENKCPDEYKLVDNTKKCVKNYKSENNKYEYYGICYDTCKQYSSDTDHDHICILRCNNYENKYFNYLQNACIDKNDIPEGYYINDTTLRTIDKCYDTCQTCNKGPIENNNNCLTCKNPAINFLYKGNCIQNCNNGYYEEDGIKICKCLDNIQCKECNDNKECLSCNNDEEYYEIENSKNNNDIIKCEKNPEGYYLDTGNKIYVMNYVKHVMNMAKINVLNVSQIIQKMRMIINVMKYVRNIIMRMRIIIIKKFVLRNVHQI